MPNYVISNAQENNVEITAPGGFYIASGSNVAVFINKKGQAVAAVNNWDRITKAKAVKNSPESE